MLNSGIDYATNASSVSTKILHLKVDAFDIRSLDKYVPRPRRFQRTQRVINFPNNLDATESTAQQKYHGFI